MLECFGEDKMETIKFWEQEEQYGWMSNFHKSPIVVDSKTWPTSEHYYQAQKHTGCDLFDQIAEASTPAKAKRLAKKKDHAMTEEQKISAMRTAVLAKFTQHDFLRKGLIATGTSIIVEDSPYDSYWGTGSDGDGINMMGLLLMELRCKLQQTL